MPKQPAVKPIGSTKSPISERPKPVPPYKTEGKSSMPPVPIPGPGDELRITRAVNGIISHHTPKGSMETKVTFHGQSPSFGKRQGAPRQPKGRK